MLYCLEAPLHLIIKYEQYEVGKKDIYKSQIFALL